MHWWQSRSSKIFITDEAVALWVALEDAFYQAPGWVVLFVCALIKLVCALVTGSSCSSATRSLTFACWCRGGGTTLKDTRFLSFDAAADFVDFVRVFAKVYTVECHESRTPNLDCCAKLLVLLVLSCEHGIHRVLDEVQVLDLRVVSSYDAQGFVQITHCIVG